MKCIIGKKVQMSQIWNDQGKVVPVTIIEAEPCVLTQVKNVDKDGYEALQFGFSAKGESASGRGTSKKLSKPMQGHLKDLPPLEILKEFRIKNNEELRIGDREAQRGDVVDVTQFSPGDKVKVTGTSKGKGFQGVVKRHGFHGSPATHGHKDQLRMPGSIGAGGVQKVFKGRKMAGRMGGEKITVYPLEIVAIDKEKNQIMIKGAVPGARGGLITITAI